MLTCEICKKEFENQRALMTHKRFAHGKKKFGKKLTEEQITVLIDDWGKKSAKEFSEIFGVEESEINNTVKVLRKAVDMEGNPANLCPPLRGSATVKTVLSKRGFRIP